MMLVKPKAGFHLELPIQIVELLEFKNNPEIVLGHLSGLGLLVLNLVELVYSEGRELLLSKLTLKANHAE